MPLARSLVEEGLAACVNVLPPMQSVYRWQGNVEEATERQLVIKTTVERAKALEKRLLELHPYEVPEIVFVPVSGGSTAYLAWLAASVATEG
jgi:periplasmic divalent cation tolerance protein